MFTAPRGTRDFSPVDMGKRQFLHQRMTAVFHRYGYQEIQTPSFEHLELFTEKSGAGIIDELYAFEDKSGRSLSLRPELTAPVIRFYIEQLQMQPKPLKLFYFGNCFRYDRPQKGRYREFWQMGCELIGTDKPEAVAELIALGYHVLADTGLQNITLHVGHVGLLQQQLLHLEQELSQDTSTSRYPGSSSILRLIDKEDFDEMNLVLSESGATPEQIDAFTQFLQCTTQKELSSYAHTEKMKTLVTQYESVLDFLKEYGITSIHRSMKIARGLDYYTGIVFEIEAPALGAEKQLCGGGEYQLVGQFGGADLPTSGFAIGFDRTLLALEQEHYSFPPHTLDVFIIPVEEKQLPHAIHLAQELRKHDFSVDMDLARRGMSKAIKYANAQNAQFLILIGPDELKQNQVTIRNMKTGEQTQVKRNKITTFFHTQ